MSSSSRKAISSIMDCMVIAAKSAARMSGTEEPGFNHALRMTVHHMDPDRDLWNKEEMKLLTPYKVMPEVCLDGKTMSLATNLALIDEHTTLATFAAKPKVLRPGVSVQLQANFYHPIPVGADIDIISSVTRMGRNLAFLSAELIGEDGTVHCRGSQVKFLPVDSLVADSILSSPKSWPFIKTYFDTMMPAVPPPPSQQDVSLNALIDSHLSVSEPGVASFEVARQHTNPFLGLHGGCHAVLMEVVGQELADSLFGTTCQLSSLQVEYHSVARGQVDVRASVLSQTEDELFMQVLIKRPTDGKIISDGSLRWKKAK